VYENLSESVKFIQDDENISAYFLLKHGTGILTKKRRLIKVSQGSVETLFRRGGKYL